MARKKKAAFVDRDGIINEMVYDEVHGILDSPRKPMQVRLCPGAPAFIKGLKDSGYDVVIVTNQPGIAKGTLTEEDLQVVNGYIADLLASEGAAWDDLRYSPFHPDGGAWPNERYVKKTDCRKPGPGMLLQAAEERDIDLAESWMIGDGLTDVQAGRRAGCRTILVTKLKVNQIEAFLDLQDAEPDHIAPDLQSALKIIQSSSNGEVSSGP